MQRIKIVNGTVYDPAAKTMSVRDIAIADRKIVDPQGFREDILIDAEGCLVTPGLIDFHLHCFAGVADASRDADTFCLPNGTTTCIDAGTAGTAAYRAFHADVVSRSATRVLSLLCPAPEGQTTGRHPENQNPADWDRGAIEALVERYPEIVGLKVRLGHNICAPYGMTDEPLREAVKVGEEIGKRVVVHVNNPDVSTEQIADILRPGDVYCHMYAGADENIVGPDGHVKPGIIKARERGVIFDACNGRGNFFFKVAEPAIADGFLPDIISSDMSVVGNYIHPLISLPRLLSKYLMFGMPLTDVIDQATIAPARWLHMESLASLACGTEADVAIFRLKNKPVLHRDAAGEERTGKEVLVPQLTIRDGYIAYAQSDFL